MAMNWKITTAAMLFAITTAWVAVPNAQAQDTAVDPVAVQKLRQMTDYMRALPYFRVRTENTLEDTLDSGQRVDNDVTSIVTLRRPDKLRVARVWGMSDDRELFFNGTTFALYSPTDNMYARYDAKATVGQLLDNLRMNLGVVMPGADLVYPNAFDIIMSQVTSATVVGQAVIEGAICHHLAFSSPGADAQVWVADGEQPLPCKYVVTDTSTPELISTVSVLSEWDLVTVPPDSEFEFVPPTGAQATIFLPRDNAEEAGR